MHDDDTLLGLEHAGRVRQHRGGRPVFSSRGAIYHPNARTSSRSKGQSARAAVAYIQRTAEYSRDQDRADELLYTESGHMPAWAEADPTDYWNAADLYERTNGRLFKRLEFALPVALTADEHLPYTLAIHAGAGTNPHCHLLISERTNDGLERSPEQWFSRYNAAAPEQGGARKTEALKPKAWLAATREAWAEQANAALEEAGLEVRIDHRSLAAQGIERLPSLHLGPTVQAMEARGIETERGAEVRRREQVNAQLADLGTQREEVGYERPSQREQLERGGAGVDRAVAALGEPDGGLAAGRERAASRGLEDSPGRGRGAAAERGAAVAALQVARQPTWVEIAELVIYGIGLAAIYWHLWDMKKYSQRRDREIDAWAASLRETNRKLAESSRGWAESHQRLAENTRMLGQLLEQQRQARSHPSH